MLTHAKTRNLGFASVIKQTIACQIESERVATELASEEATAKAEKRRLATQKALATKQRNKAQKIFVANLGRKLY